MKLPFLKNKVSRRRKFARALAVIAVILCAFFLVLASPAKAADLVNNPPVHTTYLDGCTKADRGIVSFDCPTTPTKWILGNAPNFYCYLGGIAPTCAADKVYSCNSGSCRCIPGQINCGGTCQDPVDVECADGQEPDRCNGTCIGSAYALVDIDPTNIQSGDIQIDGTMEAGEFCVAGAYCLDEWSNFWWVGAGDEIFNSNTGNVGIGTATPDAKLTVNETDTDPLFNVYYDGTKKLEIKNDGSVVITDSGSDVAAGVLTVRGDGTGTQNIFSAIDGASNLFVVRANGNVGIGTATPGKPLDVAGAGGIRISRTENISSDNEIFFQDNGRMRSKDDNHQIIFDRSNNVLELREYGDIIFSAGATFGSRTNSVAVHSSGKVGIGIGDAVPAAKLEVGGNVLADDFCIDGGDCMSGLGSLWSENGSDIYYDSGRVGIGTNAPGYPLDVSSDTSTAVLRFNDETDGSLWTGVQLARNGSEKWFIGLAGPPETPSDKLYFRRAGLSNDMVIDTSGKVGIGVTAPSQALDLIGSLELEYTTTPTTGVIYKGVDSFIHNFQHPTGDTEVPDGFNTFVGIGAGNFTMGSTATDAGQASGNSGFGYFALRSNTTGSNNSAVGIGALYSNTTGYSNTAMGTTALMSNTEGYQNSAVGFQALQHNTTGYSNTAMGYNALYWNTEGSYNTAMGYSALQYNATGSYNIAMGHNALFYNKGSYNIAMGYDAGLGISGSTVSNNVFIGYEAGRSIQTTGDDNVMIGWQAGDSVTTGAGNILIGYDVDTPTVATSNHLNIGNTIYGDLSTGNVGIGVTAPSEKLHVAGKVRADNFCYPSSTGAFCMSSAVRSAGSGLGGRVSFWINNSMIGGDPGFIWDNANDRLGIGAGSPGYLLDVRNATASGTAVMRLDNYDPTRLWTGTILSRQNAEKWFVGMGDADDKLLIRRNGTTNDVAIDTSGNVGIGTTGPAYPLHVIGDAAKTAGGSSWTVPSDRRTKRDIHSFIDGLDVVMQIDPVNFTYNGLGQTVEGERGVGVIAQDVKDIVPYMVDVVPGRLNENDASDTDLHVFNASALPFINLNAIRELADMVDARLVVKTDGSISIDGDIGAENNEWGTSSGWITCQDRVICECPDGSFMTAIWDKGAAIKCNKL